MIDMTTQTTALTELRNFVSVRDLNGRTVQALVDFSIRQKQWFRQGRLTPSLTGKTLAMVFQKPSLRTRLSFEVAMTQLGGHAVNMDHHHISMGAREAVADVARVISGMCDSIMARVFEHQDVETLARYATVPVINGLSDWVHPCQAMADVMTLQEHFGSLPGRRLAFVGDGNNVARSLAMVCAKLSMPFVVATPAGYQLDDDFLRMVKNDNPDADLQCTSDPAEAVRDADVVYTDTWTSMGQEEEKESRASVFHPYQVNAALLAHARPTAVVMHCLPAYRGQEITDDVLDGPQSIVFDQSANRLHFQRALLELLIGRRQGIEEGSV